MALQLIIGPMYSGKSTELIRKVKHLQSIGMKCLVINHSNDTRVDGDFVQTHAGDQFKATKTDDLLLAQTRIYDAIAIDEGQFFHNLKTAVHFMLQRGKCVIVAGLNGDYQRNPFGQMLELIPMAENVIFKHAVCTKCQKEACFTKRIGHQTQTVLVNCKYIAVCRQCYEKE